jgi:hypothetical protein
MVNAGESARDAVDRMAAKYKDEIAPDGLPYKLSCDAESPYYWKRLFGALEIGIYCNGALIKNVVELDRRTGVVRYDDVGPTARRSEKSVQGNIEIAFSGARPIILPEDLLASELDAERIQRGRVDR